MPDKKDQSPDSPSQEPTVLPFKKRDTVEKTLPGSSGGAETMSSDSNHDDSFAMNKKLKLDELKEKAYFHVLHAFAAESVAISSPRITIINELKKEWNIAYKTHIAFENKIKADILADKLRKKSLASVEKEKQKVAAAEESKTTAVEGNPMNKDDVSGKKEKAVATCAAPTLSSWGSFNPESLVGKLVRVRMPDEENFEEFLIKEYDAEHEMHRFEAVDPDAMERDEMLSWMDVREVPPGHIMWANGERPDF